MRRPPHLYPGQTALHPTLLYWTITGSWHLPAASGSWFPHMMLWAWMTLFPFYLHENLSAETLNTEWGWNSYLDAQFEVNHGVCCDEWRCDVVLCLPILSISKAPECVLDALSSLLLTVAPTKATFSSLNDLLEFLKPRTLVAEWLLSLQHVADNSQIATKSISSHN